MSAIVSQIRQLSTAEKWQLFEELWAVLAEDPDQIPVHDWQLEELQKRKENFERSGLSLTWEEAKAQIMKQ